MASTTPSKWPLLTYLLFVSLYNVKSASISLSEDQFEEETTGKTVFLKFFAPWCGHCQELAPAWERLGLEFTSDQGRIAEIDCTQHESWCIKLGVTAFPTLMYGDPSHNGIFLEEYTSTDKTVEALMSFAESTLHRPICSPGNIDVCDPDTRERLYRYWNTSRAELQSIISAQEEQIRLAEQEFKSKMDRMQQAYDAASLDYEITTAQLKRQVRLFKELLD